MKLDLPGTRAAKLAAILFLTASTAAPAEVLGKIGDIEIKTDEVREALAGLEASQEAALASDPATVSTYLRALLVQRLVLKKAAEQKFDQDPAVIAKLVRARETALAEAYLESFSQPAKDYPGEAELQAGYESAKPSLALPKSYRLAQIFTADEAKLADILKKLKAKDTNFGNLARSLSEEKTSAAKDGEIGWLAENQIQPEIKDKLPKLTVGTVSEPIQLKDGWHLIKIIEVRETSTATLEQVRPQLILRLRQEKSKQLKQEFVASLVKQNPIAINEIELSKILPHSP